MTIPNAPVERTAPEGYTEALYWRISDSKSKVIRIQLWALLFTVVWLSIFYLIARYVGGMTGGLPGNVWLWVVPIVVVMPLHEFIHGMAMRSFGARPQYGVMWKQLMLYATSPGYPFPRDHFLVVAFAPLSLISVLVVCGIAWLSHSFWVFPLALGGTVNAAGAIGDIWIAGIVLRYPSSAKIMDERDGVRVFVRQ
jgi:hypothetical protein